MGLLERLVGPDAARQFRERMLASSPAAQAAPGAPAAPEASSAAAVRPARGAARPAALADPPGLADLAGDFPTSILATAAEPAPPLLSAFANRPALLAALVFSEALAPPVALR